MVWIPRQTFPGRRKKPVIHTNIEGSEILKTGVTIARTNSQ